jgi:radical SAM superfamily enzyme YgiQ (UPF0313 family)
VNVCLIGAPTASELDSPHIAETEAARTIAEHAPLGVLSLAAVLEACGRAPTVVDPNRLYYEFHRNRHEHSDFSRVAAAYVAQVDADFFGFSTVCSSYPLTLRIVSELKRLRPDAVVALGGPQASVVDVATLRHFPSVDLVVRGEAEETLPQLLDAISARSAVNGVDVPGVTLRRGEDIRRNPDAPAILDLDSLPFPAYHLVPHLEACHVLPLELGRGCPFACTFCSTNDFFRRRFRLKSPARVLNDMRRLNAAYGIDTFELVHDMFTVDRARVVAFCEALLAAGEPFYWGCSARTDCIDGPLVELMAQAGCRGIFFGIETGSARLQQIIDKRLDLREAADLVRACDASAIKTAVSLIAGFPEETMDDLRDTASFFMRSLRYDHADPQLCTLAPLAATPIYQQHQHDLRLEDAADMSYRGWDQAPEDVALIAEHRDIFPNFYTVPTPFLDHEFVKELRDFLLNGMKVLRPLMLDLQEASGDMLEVFHDWRRWRARNKPRFADGERAAYYEDALFPRDFLEFVQVEYLVVCDRANSR